MSLEEEKKYNISKKNINKKDPIGFFRKNSYSREELNSVNTYIHSVLSNKLDGKVNRVLCYRHSDIILAVNLYDKLVLGGLIKNSGRELICRVSHHEATFNGKTDIIKGKIRMVIYIQKLSTTFTEDRKYSFNSRCYDRLECMLSVIRHELIHVFVKIFGNEADYSEAVNHGNLFKLLYSNIFDGSVTMSYGTYDVDIYPERGILIGSKLKKGKEAKIIQPRKELKTVIVLEEPITYENSELIRYKTKGGTESRTELLLFKSPEEVKREDTRKNTILSPISSQHYIKKDITKKTKEGYRLGLSKQRFTKEALKRGVDPKDIPKLYQKYNKERKELQGGV